MSRRRDTGRRGFGGAGCRAEMSEGNTRYQTLAHSFNADISPKAHTYFKFMTRVEEKEKGLSKWPIAQACIETGRSSFFTVRGIQRHEGSQSLFRTEKVEIMKGRREGQSGPPGGRLTCEDRVNKLQKFKELADVGPRLADSIQHAMVEPKSIEAKRRRRQMQKSPFQVIQMQLIIMRIVNDRRKANVCLILFILDMNALLKAIWFMGKSQDRWFIHYILNAYSLQ